MSDGNEKQPLEEEESEKSEFQKVYEALLRHHDPAIAGRLALLQTQNYGKYPPGYFKSTND